MILKPFYLLFAFPFFSAQDASSDVIVDSDTGVLTCSLALKSNRSVTVMATGTTMLSATVVVTISVIADNGVPRFPKLLYDDVSVKEDASVGTVLMMLQAEGSGGDVVYQIQDVENNNQVCSVFICKQIQ